MQEVARTLDVASMSQDGGYRDSVPVGIEDVCTVLFPGTQNGLAVWILLQIRKTISPEKIQDQLGGTDRILM